MKTKVALTALMSILLTNVYADQHSLKGDVNVRYASEHHRRGTIVSQDAIQTSVGATVGVGSLNVFGDVLRSSAIDTGSDVLDSTIGVHVSLPSKLELYAGLYNSDIELTGNTLEGFLSLQASVLLNPTFVVYRDVSDDMYTYEAQLSHSFDLGLCRLQLSGFVGSTDTDSGELTYYGTTASLNKSIRDNVDLYANLSFSDTDEREEEYVWSTGFSVKF